MTADFKRVQHFGIDSIALTDALTGIPYTPLMKIVGSYEATFEGEIIENVGGSSPFPYDAQNGRITTDTSLTIREFPTYLWQLLMGATVNQFVDETTGFVGDFQNRKGTSAFDAAIGIASVSATVGSETDLKFTKYVVEAVSATTVDVYALSNVDFNRGTVGVFSDTTQKINVAPLTITDAGTVDIPDFGITLTGGTVVAMVVGDTAEFDVRPISDEAYTVELTANLQTKPFGLAAYGQKNNAGQVFSLELYKVVGFGLPFTFTEVAYQETALTLKALNCERKNSVGNYKIVTGSGATC